jgi:hypothetical protein
MPNSTTVVCESPRLGKGVNKRFAEDDGLQQKIPKKTKPYPPEEDKAAPNANDPPASTTKGKGLSTDQHLSALKAKADVWEKEDSQKTKKVLVQKKMNTPMNTTPSFGSKARKKQWQTSMPSKPK